MYMNPTTIQNNDHKIVRFTNISYFDFTSEMGAMYGGVPYFVPAGKSMLMPMPIGDHLATHLARQIILQKAPIRDEKETDGKGSDRKLWDEKAILDLKTKIVSEVYEEERPEKADEASVMAARVAALNRDFVPEAPVPTAPVVDAPVAGGSTSGYQDKAEVIAELKKRGIQFDARGSKAKLEELLK